MFNAIKWVFIFLYHFFFIDQSTGQQSNTKFFANIGYIVWCVLFPYAVIHGSKAQFDLWLVFGSVVIGNRTLNVMLQNKAGGPGNGDGSWKHALTQPQSSVDGDLDDKSAVVVQTTSQTTSHTISQTPAQTTDETPAETTTQTTAKTTTQTTAQTPASTPALVVPDTTDLGSD